jgi:hypothetical protein
MLELRYAECQCQCRKKEPLQCASGTKTTCPVVVTQAFLSIPDNCISSYFYTVQLMDEMLPTQTRNLHQKVGVEVVFPSFVHQVLSRQNSIDS